MEPEAARGLEIADELEIGVSRSIASLLASNVNFDHRGHDGHLTMVRLLCINGVRDFLTLKFGLSIHVIHNYMGHPTMPDLKILSLISHFWQQPLNKIILGELEFKPVVTIPEDTFLGGNIKYDWKSIERDLKLVIRSRSGINVKEACNSINIGASTVRCHFPDLLKKIAAIRKQVGSEKAKKRQREERSALRAAFRSMVEAGDYPALARLQDVTGIYQRKISQNYPDLIDEEWRRAEKKTSMRKREHSS